MQQNFLSPIGFGFAVKRLPNVSFFVQGATIPGLSVTQANVATPFKTIILAGDKLEHEPFSITIRMDENMESYREIFNWMVSITKAHSYEQFKALKESEDGLYSDASLVILNSKGNPSLEVKFKDIFPINIGQINLNTTEQDVNYVTCDITFEHNGHEVVSIVKG